MKLEVLQIASPCTVAWDSMKGDDRTRLCATCKQNVFDLSAMTREEAEELVGGVQEKLCVRVARRADGTVVTRDCTPDRLAAAKRLARRSIAVAAAMAAAIAAAIGGAGWLVSSEPLCSLTTRDASLGDRIAAAWEHKPEPVVRYAMGHRSR